MIGICGILAVAVPSLHALSETRWRVEEDAESLQGVCVQKACS